MTVNDIDRLGRTVEAGRRLLGRITVLKERLAWIEAREPLYIAFDRGASKMGSTSAQRVPIEQPSAAVVERVRDLIETGMRQELSELVAELEALV